MLGRQGCRRPLGAHRARAGRAARLEGVRRAAGGRGLRRARCDHPARPRAGRRRPALLRARGDVARARHGAADQQVAGRRAAHRRRRPRAADRHPHWRRARGARRPVQPHDRAAARVIRGPRAQGRRAHRRTAGAEQPTARGKRSASAFTCDPPLPRRRDPDRARLRGDHRRGARPRAPLDQIAHVAQPPTAPCSCSARRAPARSSSRARSTTQRRAATGRSSRSTARALPRDAARERALRPREGRLHRRDGSDAPGASSWPTAARCSSTRSASCRSRCRRSCCACCRSASSSASAASATLHVDVRVVAATNRDLESAVREANVPRGPLLPAQRRSRSRVPPLRERREDIPLLARHFLRRRSRASSASSVAAVARRRVERCTRYDWPGNVRELANVVERAAILSRGSLLDALEPFGTGSPSARAGPPAYRAAQTPPSADSLEDVERAHIHYVLQQTRWVIPGQASAALVLGMNPAPEGGQCASSGSASRTGTHYFTCGEP